MRNAGYIFPKENAKMLNVLIASVESIKALGMTLITLFAYAVGAIVSLLMILFLSLGGLIYILVQDSMNYYITTITITQSINGE